MSSKGKPIACSGGPVTSDVKGNSGKASHGKNLTLTCGVSERAILWKGIIWPLQ